VEQERTGKGVGAAVVGRNVGLGEGEFVVGETVVGPFVVGEPVVGPPNARESEKANTVTPNIPP